MGRALRYVDMHRKSAHNPLRVGPTCQHPAAIWGAAYYDGTWNQPRSAPPPAPVEASVPTAPVVLDPARELRNARPQCARPCGPTASPASRSAR